jgi:hypothetical protein
MAFRLEIVIDASGEHCQPCHGIKGDDRFGFECAYFRQRLKGRIGESFPRLPECIAAEEHSRKRGRP